MQCTLCGRNGTNEHLCPECKERIGNRKIFAVEIPRTKQAFAEAHPLRGSDFHFQGYAPANTKPGQIFEVKDNGRIKYARLSISSKKTTGERVVEGITVALSVIGMVAFLGSCIQDHRLQKVGGRLPGAVYLIEIGLIAIAGIIGVLHEKITDKSWGQYVSTLTHIDGRYSDASAEQDPRSSEQPGAFRMITCPHCGQQTPEGEFCVKCGKAFLKRCPACGTQLPEDAEFCLRCGKPLQSSQ